MISIFQNTGFLGTDPTLHTATVANVRSVNYQDTDKELAKLNATIKDYLSKGDNKNDDTHFVQVGGPAEHGKEDESEEEKRSNAQHNGNFLKILPSVIFFRFGPKNIFLDKIYLVNIIYATNKQRCENMKI